MQRKLSSLFLIVPLLLMFALTLPAQAQAPCSNAPAPQLSVGGFGRVTDPNGMSQYSGNPYVNRYLNLRANAAHEFYGVALSEDDPSWRHDFSGDPLVFVTEGPVCLDGVNMWRVEASDGTANVWVPETAGNRYVIEPAAGQVSSAPAYTPARVVLTEVAPDLVVDGLAQLSFGGLGGGGEGLPFYDGEATVGELYDFVLSVYPPGTLVDVALRSPEGNTLAASPVYAWEDTGTPVSYVTARTPAYPGLATGIWTVELRGDGETRRIAYRLRQPDSPAITPACDRTEPTIYVSGLRPNETITLAQVELNDLSVNDDFQQSFEVVNRWRLQADSQGTLVIVDFKPYVRPVAPGSDQERFWGIESAGGSWMDDQSYESVFLRINAEWDCYSSQVGVPPSSIWSFGSDLPARLTAGDRARVVPGDANNVRDQPTTSGARIGQVPGGAEFLVLDGPAFGDDLRWWLIEYNGLIGWTVEGQGTEYWLEPLSVR